MCVRKILFSDMMHAFTDKCTPCVPFVCIILPYNIGLNFDADCIKWNIACITDM